MCKFYIVNIESGFNDVVIGHQYLQVSKVTVLGNGFYVGDKFLAAQGEDE